MIFALSMALAGTSDGPLSVLDETLALQDCAGTVAECSVKLPVIEDDSEAQSKCELGLASAYRRADGSIIHAVSARVATRDELGIVETNVLVRVPKPGLHGVCYRDAVSIGGEEVQLSWVEDKGSAELIEALLTSLDRKPELVPGSVLGWLIKRLAERNPATGQVSDNRLLSLPFGGSRVTHVPISISSRPAGLEIAQGGQTIALTNRRFKAEIATIPYLEVRFPNGTVQLRNCPRQSIGGVLFFTCQPPRSWLAPPRIPPK